MQPPSLRSLLSKLPLSAGISRGLGLVIIVLAVVGTLYAFREKIPVPLLLAVLILLLVGGLAWGLLVGLPMLRERRFLNRFRAEFGGEAERDELQPRRDIVLAADEARRVLRSRRDGTTDNQRLPWLYLLGDTGQVRGLLDHAARLAPFPPPDVLGNPGRLWHFWFLRDCVAVELSGRFICPQGDIGTRRLWFHALLTGRKLRPELPLNGLVLVLPVAILEESSTERHGYVVNARRVIDEAFRVLSVDVPVYVLFSGCDGLPGADVFLPALSPETRQQALGHGFAADRPMTEILADLDGPMDELGARIHQIALGMLGDARSAAQRQAIFAFARKVGDLRPTLCDALRAIFQESPLQRTGRLRGVYLVGGRQNPVFIDDLFTGLLPRDAGLARKTASSRQLRMGLAAATGGVALALSGIATYSLLAGDPAVERAYGDVIAACTGAGPLDGIETLTACADRLRAFETVAATEGGFGALRSRFAVGRVRSGWVEAWHGLVAVGLYRGLEADLARDQPDFAARLAVLQSLALVEACRSGQSASCAPVANRFPELLARLGVRTAAEQVAGAHAAYLAWQSDAQRTETRERLGDLRRAGWDDTPPSVADLVGWANGIAPPLTLSRFWGGTQGIDAAALAGGFSLQAWESGVADTLALIERWAGADAAARLARAFHAERQEAWARFLSRFGEGVTSWSVEPAGLKRVLAVRENHPFELLWAEFQRTVMATTPVDQQRPWVRVLVGVAAGPWSEAAGRLQDVAVQLTRSADGQAGYAIAADAFRAGSSVAARDSAQLWQAIEQFASVRQSLGPDAGPSDRAALDMLDAFPRTILLAALNDASDRIETAWRDSVAIPYRELPRPQRAPFLGGPRGALARFAETWLAPFQVPGSSRPQTLLGVQLPVSPDFLALQDRFIYAAEQQGPAFAGVITVTAGTQFGSLAEGAGGTTVEVVCQQGTYTAMSAGGPATRRANVFWAQDACVEVRLTVAVPETLAPEGGASLVRSWSGADSLERFSREFGKGRRSVRLADFQHGLTAEQWQRLIEAVGPDGTIPVAVSIQFADGFSMDRRETDAVPSRVLQPVL